MPRTSSHPIPQDQAQSDHDILIELRTEFREFRGQITDALVKMNESLDKQHVDMNARLLLLETFRQTKVADEKIQQWSEAAHWVSTYRNRWKWIASLVGLGAAVLGYIASTLIPLWRGG